MVNWFKILCMVGLSALIITFVLALVATAIFVTATVLQEWKEERKIKNEIKKKGGGNNV